MGFVGVAPPFVGIPLVFPIGLRVEVADGAVGLPMECLEGGGTVEGFLAPIDVTGLGTGFVEVFVRLVADLVAVGPLVTEELGLEVCPDVGREEGLTGLTV